MAGYDRWGSDRYRRGGERHRDYDRLGPDADHFTRSDRESFGRGEGFGRGSRDYPGGRDYQDYGPERDGMGRPDEPGRDWVLDDRAGHGGPRYGRDHGPEDERGRERRAFRGRDPWSAEPRDRERPGVRGRSVGEMAFGRSQDGRDDPGGFGRRDERDRGGWFDRMGDEIASWFGGEHDDDRLRRLDLRDRGDSGQHRGRGPKSYQRSDARILEDINDRLTDDPQLDASDIEVGVSGREVTLSGTVANRYEKRRAEDLTDSVSGVIHVQNNLRVRARGPNWSDERVDNTTDITGLGSSGTGGPRSGTGS
jgi:hypothetical protein